MYRIEINVHEKFVRQFGLFTKLYSDARSTKHEVNISSLQRIYETPIRKILPYFINSVS